METKIIETENQDEVSTKQLRRWFLNKKSVESETEFGFNALGGTPDTHFEPFYLPNGRFGIVFGL